jgi:hypothetical protein
MAAMTGMTTATVMATATMTMGKDDNNSKDNDSKDNGNDGKDDNNDGSNGSGGGGVAAGGGQGNVRLVTVLRRALVVWRLHTIGIIQMCFGI